MAGINDFLASLSGGGARPNRFEVVVDFPAFAASQEEIRKTSFLCQSTSLPGSNLGIMTVGFRGRELKLAGDRTYDDWEVTFYNDTDFAIHDAMERWHNGINQYNSNTGLPVPDDYLSTVSVYQLDSNDNRIKEYVLKLSFPTVIGPIELGQDSNDAIETFSVTFAYSDIDNGQST
jgi:hypothetical protein